MLDDSRRDRRAPRFGRTPWYARQDTRLAAVVVALLIVAGGAAFAARPTGGTPAEGETIAVVTSTTALGGTATSVVELTATPTLEPTREPMVVDLRPDAVGNGETMALWVYAPGASSVAVDLEGERYMLSQEGRVHWGVIGFPLDAPLGPALLSVTGYDDAGAIVETGGYEFEVVHVERPVDYLELTPEEASVLTPEAGALEASLRTAQFSQFDRPRRWTGFFQLPTEGVITTLFGQGRSYNGGPVGSFHTGTDYANELGTPVHAAAAGRVSFAEAMPIRGNSVVIDHGAGVKTGYHHLSSIEVEVGQLVEAGDLIGLMGSTGLSTGSHLHWEVSVWGVNVDPGSWTYKDFTP